MRTYLVAFLLLVTVGLYMSRAQSFASESFRVIDVRGQVTSDRRPVVFNDILMGGNQINLDTRAELLLFSRNLKVRIFGPKSGPLSALVGPDMSMNTGSTSLLDQLFDVFQTAIGFVTSRSQLSVSENNDVWLMAFETSGSKCVPRDERVSILAPAGADGAHVSIRATAGGVPVILLVSKSLTVPWPKTSAIVNGGEYELRLDTRSGPIRWTMHKADHDFVDATDLLNFLLHTGASSS